MYSAWLTADAPDRQIPHGTCVVSVRPAQMSGVSGHLKWQQLSTTKQLI